LQYIVENLEIYRYWKAGMLERLSKKYALPVYLVRRHTVHRRIAALAMAAVPDI
jgi:hypothetical protein